MDVISAQIEREHPRENDGIGAAVVPMLDDTVRHRAHAAVHPARRGGGDAAHRLREPGESADGARARAPARARRPRGARRRPRRLVAQSIAELVPMLLAGGALGLLGAAWVVDALVPLLPADIPRVENIGLHLPVLASAAATLAAIAVFVGVWPALEASRGGLAASIGDLSRGSTGRAARARAARHAGRRADRGDAVAGDRRGAADRAASRAAARSIPASTRRASTACTSRFRARSIPNDRDVAAFCRRVLERVRALPGVVSAGMVNRLPLAGGDTDRRRSSSRASIRRPPALAQRRCRSVTPDYFRTLQIPLLERPHVHRSRRRGRAAGRRSSTSGWRDASSAAPIRSAAAFRPPILNLALVDDRRRRRPHPARAPRRGRPAAGLLELQAAHAGSDGAGRADQDRSRRRSRGRSPAAIRSVDPEQPVYDARTLDGGRRSIGRAALAADDAARSVRGHRAGAGEHRRLRRDCLRGRTTAARVRHPPRARRPARARSSRWSCVAARVLFAVRRGDGPDRRRRHRARARRACCSTSRLRSRQLRRRDARPLRGRARRLRPSGAPRGERRSVDRASRRIGRAPAAGVGVSTTRPAKRRLASRCGMVSCRGSAQPVQIQANRRDRRADARPRQPRGRARDVRPRAAGAALARRHDQLRRASRRDRQMGGQEPLATDPEQLRGAASAGAPRPGRVHIDDVPLQPWARAIVGMRARPVSRRRAVHALQAVAGPRARSEPRTAWSC